MSNSSPRKVQNIVEREFSLQRTVDLDDMEDTSDENQSDEEELNERKKQHVVLGTYKYILFSSYHLPSSLKSKIFSMPMNPETDAQTKRFINAVAIDNWNEDIIRCDEIFEPYSYQTSVKENRLECFLDKVKPYSTILRDMSVYGFYKWCMKNDVGQFFRDGWPYMLREKFYDEAARDALKEPQDD